MAGMCGYVEKCEDGTGGGTMDQAGAAPAPSFLRHGGLLPAKKGNGADACLAQEGRGGQTSLAGELIWGRQPLP